MQKNIEDELLPQHGEGFEIESAIRSYLAPGKKILIVCLEFVVIMMSRLELDKRLVSI